MPIRLLPFLYRWTAAAVLFAGLVPLFPHSLPAQTRSPGPARATPQAAQSIDLNTCSAADLTALPGVGDAYAKRIVEGRPYTAKNQLVSRGVIPQATYDRIKDSIVAKKMTGSK